MSHSGKLIRSDQLVLTKTWRAVEGTRTSAHPPEGASVLSGEVLKELALRRLLVKKKPLCAKQPLILHQNVLLAGRTAVMCQYSSIADGRRTNT